MTRFNINTHMLAIQRLPIIIMDHHIDKGEGHAFEKSWLFRVVIALCNFE